MASSSSASGSRPDSKPLCAAAANLQKEREAELVRRLRAGKAKIGDFEKGVCKWKPSCLRQGSLVWASEERVHLCCGKRHETVMHRLCFQRYIHANSFRDARQLKCAQEGGDDGSMCGAFFVKLVRIEYKGGRTLRQVVFDESGSESVQKRAKEVKECPEGLIVPLGDDGDADFGDTDDEEDEPEEDHVGGEGEGDDTWAYRPFKKNEKKSGEGGESAAAPVQKFVEIRHINPKIRDGPAHGLRAHCVPKSKKKLARIQRRNKAFKEQRDPPEKLAAAGLPAEGGAKGTGEGGQGRGKDGGFKKGQQGGNRGPKPGPSTQGEAAEARAKPPRPPRRTMNLDEYLAERRAGGGKRGNRKDAMVRGAPVDPDVTLTEQREGVMNAILQEYASTFYKCIEHKEESCRICLRLALESELATLDYAIGLSPEAYEKELDARVERTISRGGASRLSEELRDLLFERVEIADKMIGLLRNENGESNDAYLVAMEKEREEEKMRTRQKELENKQKKQEKKKGKVKTLEEHLRSSKARPKRPGYLAFLDASSSSEDEAAVARRQAPLPWERDQSAWDLMGGLGGGGLVGLSYDTSQVESKQKKKEKKAEVVRETEEERAKREKRETVRDIHFPPAAAASTAKEREEEEQRMIREAVRESKRLEQEARREREQMKAGRRKGKRNQKGNLDSESSSDEEDEADELRKAMAMSLDDAAERLLLETVEDEEEEEEEDDWVLEEIETAKEEGRLPLFLESLERDPNFRFRQPRGDDSLVASALFPYVLQVRPIRWDLQPEQILSQVRKWESDARRWMEMLANVGELDMPECHDVMEKSGGVAEEVNVVSVDVIEHTDDALRLFLIISCREWAELLERILQDYASPLATEGQLLRSKLGCFLLWED
uniref:Uncharacterized protein n=1 Tax=Chromera velia CCMP2878 TaxID=1169474 RepID=A0A0G4GDD7_9ALVE|eukprot:Cvel_21369.t1-p1 / transcript=Cvel_21369.t1 / gene=Cvel_21369 / organism=Chromera_velia_CCMP2878 / gene_product=hypothetical protein / transcript_product=hypothetical protein / location=Cvel_scaffold1998:17373-21718(+) / protein_length=890 / sequence_SO=supercontig / SO=protein_coding / is_pseudo=false